MHEYLLLDEQIEQYRRDGHILCAIRKIVRQYRIAILAAVERLNPATNPKHDTYSKAFL